MKRILLVGVSLVSGLAPAAVSQPTLTQSGLGAQQAAAIRSIPIISIENPICLMVVTVLAMLLALLGLRWAWSVPSRREEKWWVLRMLRSLATSIVKRMIVCRQSWLRCVLAVF